MADSYIGLDLGTSNLKGVLIRGGRIAASAVRRVAFLRPEPDRTEIEPEGYFALVLDLIRELAGRSGEPVAGIAAAAASGNTLLLEPDGRCAGNIVSWLDARQAVCDLDPERVYRTIGWPYVGCMSIAHLLWFRERGMLAGRHVCMNNDFVTAKLTGCDQADYSSATPFYLVDQERRCYSEWMLEAFGLKEEQLPALSGSGCAIGPLLPGFRGGALTGDTVIYTGSFDHPAAARSVGLTREDELLLSCGSSWVAFTASAERPLDRAKNVLVDPYLSESGGPWGAMRSLAQAGLRFEAFVVEHFGGGDDRYFRLRENAARSDVRAFLAGMVRDFAAIMPERRIRRIYMVGGVAQDDVCPRMIAEVTGCEVLVPGFHQYAGCVGAAVMAGAAAAPPDFTVYRP